MLRWPSSMRCRVAMRAPGDLVDRERVVAGRGRSTAGVTYGTSIESCGEGVEHAHLRRDHDEPLDALRGEMREPVGDRRARPTDSMFAVLTQ